MIVMSKNLKSGDVICPTCGGLVEEFDCLDIDYEGGKVVMFKIGECDHCGNHYQWHEEFEYLGHRDMEQIDREDEIDEPDDLECGFDPYMGCYSDDC